jgi:8-amino-7-oxononanoate synthase
VSLLDALSAELAELDAGSLRRTRRLLESAQGTSVRVDGRSYLSFCSNDYLGLAAHPALAQAAHAAIEQYGSGAGASHLVTGHSRAHHELEQALAAFTGWPAALLFSSGYMANLGVVSALVGRHDAVFADRLNHACLNDAALLSRAQFHRHAHGDLQALARQLAASSARRKLIAVDAVFSMDGDIAPLPDLLALAEQHDAWLLVDDAHGFGVLGEGRGTPAHFGLDLQRCAQRMVYMGTLGKAAGVFGAFVAGAPALVELLMQKSRTYVFTTALPPMVAGALLAGLRVIEHEPQRRQHLRALIARFRDGMRGLGGGVLAASQTAIQPWIVGTPQRALALSAALAGRGVLVPAIRPPTVPAGSSRLRISLSAAHTFDDVDRLCLALRAADEGAASAHR